jgi:hypothetical protein
MERWRDEDVKRIPHLLTSSPLHLLYREKFISGRER